MAFSWHVSVHSPAANLGDVERFTTAQVLPSLMSADVLRLGTQLDALIAAGARTFHIDVMDGHFVPNLTLGTGFAAAVADPVRAAGGMLDVHLMVERPGLMVELFADVAPDSDLFAQYSFISADDLPEFRALLAKVADGTLAAFQSPPR